EDIENRQEKNARVAYLNIKDIGDHSKIAKDLVVSLQNSIIRYVGAIDALTVIKIKKDDAKTREEADLARRLAHNALISNLDILNRYCVKHKLDREWRNMVGLDRKQVTAWALLVAPTIIQERIGV
ncbi:MAG: DUF3232 domain-containing protein, partial [Candidatus Vogelbacteria bacterium]|nr:DUF3232 domain-containing protein [Candidatus Vogelbacteria bacterium]